MNMKGRVAIVTGASSGIGEATARLLSKKGASVALVARSKAKLEKLVQELPDSAAFVCDMSKPTQVRQMVKNVVKHFGRVDILINNAGRGYDAAIENIDVDKFRDLFDLNVVGYLVAIQEVVPLMHKQKGGAIVNISSGTALMVLPHMAAYSSLKRAVAGLSLTAREEFKKDQIAVSVVYPFITATDFEKNTLRDGKMEWDEDRDHDILSADSAEFVAEKILEAITTGANEIFVHSWMKPK